MRAAGKERRSQLKDIDKICEPEKTKIDWIIQKNSLIIKPESSRRPPGVP